MTGTLLDHAEDIEALANLLDEIGGDVTDPQVADYIDQLFSETGDKFDDKVDRYVGLIRDLELQAEMRLKEAKHLADRAKTSDNQANALKDRLRYVFDRLGVAKAGKKYTASIVKCGGKQKMNLLCDPADLPQAFQIVQVVTKADSDKLRAEIEAGSELAKKYAEIMPRGTRLSVK